MNQCFEYQDGTDTGGNPIYKIKCYCNSTACRHGAELYNARQIKHNLLNDYREIVEDATIKESIKISQSMFMDK